MKGDFTRLTFRPERRYSSVRLQQGRVLLDADWNEEHDILAHRIETETVDVVGPSGAPLHAPGFHLVASVAELTPDEKALPGNANPPPGAALLVSAGRYYVDGVLAENERIVAIDAQPDLPPAGTAALVTLTDGEQVAFPPPAGTYFAYLDVWQRHLTALDDPLLRETALGPGGPDTATRTRTIAQVRLLAVPAGSGCDSRPEAWTRLLAPQRGTLEAKTVELPPPANPCSVSPAGGYRGPENQLYRVEIHDLDGAGKPRFKWSRDNGAIVTRWLGMGSASDRLRVASIGRDETERIAQDDWIELLDDERELAGRPGVMVQVAHAAGDEVTIKPATAIPAGPVAFADFKTNPKARRWGPAGLTAVTTGAWIDLESGVQVRFGAGELRTGDYWTIPARSATGKVEWPFSAPQPPFGIRHHHALLGVVEVNASGAVQASDCRRIFPPLTELPEAGGLETHNRLLHGWGVVCGLQVRCDGDRSFVRVEKGYAIACEGTDVFVNAPQRVPIVERAVKQQLLDGDGNGEAAVRLAPAAGGSFALDVVAKPVRERDFLRRVLDGTLLDDVLDDCVKPLSETLRKLMDEDGPAGGPVVGDGARNRIAALNLSVQLANESSGRNVFLSREEHERLVRLHEALSKELVSPTFCGLRDGLPKPPDYPFAEETGIGTWYGHGALHRIAFSFDGRLAYAFAGESATRVMTFDVEKGEAVADTSLALPAGASVRDLLPLRDAVVVVATSGDQSMVASFKGGDLAAPAEWVTIPSRIVARIFSFPDSREAFALVVGEGIARFDPRDPSAGQFLETIIPFNATGHLATPGASIKLPVYAGAAEKGAAAEAYDQVVEVSIAERGEMRTTALVDPAGVRRAGNDAIEVLQHRPAGARLAIPVLQAIVTGASGAKDLLTLDAHAGKPLALVPLATDGGVTLAATPDRTVSAIALEEGYVLAWAGPETGQLLPDDRAPLQIAPAGLAIGGREPLVLALNHGSGTITRVSPDYLTGKRRFDWRSWHEFRAAWMRVLRDLVSRLAQRLKDCACYHLLVDCPTCGEDDQLLLATVEIRGRQVFRICNQSRREVVTFPKLLYWLSAVPIVPLVTAAVEEFCCSVLVRTAADFGGKGDFSPARAVNRAAFRARTLDLKDLGQAVSGYASMNGAFLRRALADRLFRSGLEQKPLAHAEIRDRAPADAGRTLADSGVRVRRVVELDEALTRSVLSRAGAVPLSVAAGDEVDLFTRNGRVAFFTRAGAEPGTGAVAPVPAPTPAPTPTPVPTPAPPVGPDTAADVDRLRRRIEEMDTGYRKLIAERDEQIAGLRREMDGVRSHLDRIVQPIDRPTRPVTPVEPVRSPRRPQKKKK